MKNLIVILFTVSVLSIFNTSCQKQFEVDYSNDIKNLQTQITALQKTTDSLTAALTVTNNNVGNLSKSIDSIRTQLSLVMTQINTLNSQLTTTNANIAAINAQIATLNQQYATLLAQLNSILAQLSATPNSLSNGLVAYYPFNGNVIDYSGNNYNGTIVNTITFTQDHRGNNNSAVQLGSGYITASNFFNYTRNQSFSISFWFTLQGNSNNGGRLISTENPEGNFRIGASTAIGNGVYAFQYGGYYLYDSVPLNTWAHIVYTYSNRNVNVYKNGVLKYSQTNTDNEPLNYGTSFTIGAKAAPAYDLWHGQLDELRIYSRALTPSEIQYLATQ
jgi:cell division protein FtsB